VGPDRHADRRPFLLARGPHRRGAARWFDGAGFVEVETAALQVSPGNETHLHAFATELVGPDGARGAALSCTPRRNSPARSCSPPASGGSFDSPASSATASAGPCTIRSSPCSNGTAPASPTSALMADCAALLAEAAEAAGTTAAPTGTRGRSLRRAGAADRRRGLRAIAGIDLLATCRAAADRDGSPPGARPPASGSRRTTLVGHLQPRAGRARSSRGSASAGRPSSASIRRARRRWPGQAGIPASPSASSSMPAASNSPTASAS
jgi:elongation factor P--(R)-beta-lysine ligase